MSRGGGLGASGYLGGGASEQPNGSWHEDDETKNSRRSYAWVTGGVRGSGSAVDRGVALRWIEHTEHTVPRYLFLVRGQDSPIPQASSVRKLGKNEDKPGVNEKKKGAALCI